MLFARTTFLLPDEPSSNYDVHSETFRRGESAVWRLVLDADGGIARTRADVIREGISSKPYDVRLPSMEVTIIIILIPAYY